MAITEVVAQRNSQGGAASVSVTFTYPTTPVQGNLLIVTFSYRLATITITGTPTGWENWVEKREGNVNAVIAWKIAGAAEPTVHVWTLSASEKSAGTGMAFNSTNGWPTTPRDQQISNSGATGTTGLSTGTTATTTNTAELLIVGNHSCDTSATWSAHAGTNCTPVEISEITSTGGPTSSRNTTSTSTAIKSGTSTLEISATLSATNNWAAILGTFKENSAAASGPSPHFLRRAKELGGGLIPMGM